jgi:succinyl-diaminopimelate desuccinylase
MVDRIRLTRLLQKLISIDSQNPPGREDRIGVFVRDYLKDLGISSRVYEFAKNRTNVIASLPGVDEKRSLIITPHLDTVPAGKNWKTAPLRGVIKNKLLYGLGATDCKCNLACALEAIRSIVEENKQLGFNLIFAATADEESGSLLGLEALLDKNILKADAAVVLDSDDFEIIVAQKGLMHVKVKIQGKRAHGAYTWRGVNAIDIALEIIRDIKSKKPNYKKNKYLHPPTINTGTIKGGDKVNIVADWCEFELDFRFLPGTKPRCLLKSLREAVSRRAKKYQIEVEGIQNPFLISENHVLVTSLKQAMSKIKVKPRIQGSEGATVISFFQAKGIPAVATGFGSSGCAHTANEYVKIDNLYRGALVLEEFLKSFRFNGE